MKLRATIKEAPELDDTSVIVQFEGDERKQHFGIKWESEIFTDEKTKVKSYFTHLICSKAEPFCKVGNGK